MLPYRYYRSYGKLISIVNYHVPRIGFQKWKREADLPLRGTRPLNIINRGRRTQSTHTKITRFSSPKHTPYYTPVTALLSNLLRPSFSPGLSPSLVPLCHNLIAQAFLFVSVSAQLPLSPLSSFPRLVSFRIVSSISNPSLHPAYIL